MVLTLLWHVWEWLIISSVLLLAIFFNELFHLFNVGCVGYCWWPTTSNIIACALSSCQKTPTPFSTAVGLNTHVLYINCNSFVIYQFILLLRTRNLITACWSCLSIMKGKNITAKKTLLYNGLTTPYDMSVQLVTSQTGSTPSTPYYHYIVKHLSLHCETPVVILQNTCHYIAKHLSLHCETPVWPEATGHRLVANFLSLLYIPLVSSNPGFLVEHETSFMQFFTILVSLVCAEELVFYVFLKIKSIIWKNSEIVQIKCLDNRRDS